MSLYSSHKPILSPAQLERIANIFDNAGQGFFVAMVLTTVIQGIDKNNVLVLVFGLVDMLLCWIASIILARSKDK